MDEEILDEIIFNLGREVRYATLENREHIVAPCVMMLEGVFEGSGGPLLYREENIKKNIENWDHKPIVVRHPIGKPSACDVSILNKQKVGIILNTRWEGKKLSIEAWLDKNRLQEHSPEIYKQIQNNSKVEVSTGMKALVSKKTGNFNGKDYSGEVIEITPDHLALLSGEAGAFSVKDGAGLLQNSSFVEQFTQLILNNLNKSTEKVSMEKTDMINFLITNSKDSGWPEADKAALEATHETVLKKFVDQTTEKINNAKQVAAEKAAADKKAIDDLAAKTVVNSKKEQTVAEYLASAPPAIREVLENSLLVADREKQGYIETILNAKGNRFTKDQLESMLPGTLQATAELVSNAAPAPVAPVGSPAWLPRSGGGQGTPRGNAHKEDPKGMEIDFFANSN